MQKLTAIFLLLLLHFSEACAAPLARDDIAWLNRVAYGVNSPTIAAYQQQGRKKYLDLQLNNQADDKLPAEINAALAKLDIMRKPLALVAADFREEFKHIKALPATERPSVRQAQTKYALQLVHEAMQRHLLRAIYSPAQLKEQLVWFWLNHFSVFQGKGTVRWLVSYYEESAIRPHALGKFRDLVISTLRHPAMLVYLDNAQNASHKINENYARELMELHTLGVDGGYSQQDVQELSRILTGVGVNWSDDYPKLAKNLESYYRRADGFEFNPARHDFGDKTLLGQKISGQGFAEVEQAVDMLSRHPSTARFISRKLAVYFVSDAPSAALVEQMAKTFQATDGDIAATLRTLFESKEFIDSLGKKISDPLHYVVAALRFAYDGQSLTDVHVAINWLNALGEPLYGHLTPDGYGMTEKDWASPGQLARRFEIAKQIGNSNVNMFTAASGGKARPGPAAKLSSPLFYSAIEPALSAQTKAALEKAISPLEWNTFLLAAPEFTYR